MRLLQTLATHDLVLTDFTDVSTLIFETRYKIQDSEETLSIWRAGMDTGGGAGEEGEWSRTEEIYQWIRTHGRGVVFGVKGASRPQLKRVNISVIDWLPRSTRPIRGGLELRILDTAQFKDLIHWRMTRGEHVADDGDILRESQRWYLHAETGLDYARQITAEEKRRDRRKKVVWTRIRRDNHLLDCEVIAAACADSEWLPSLAMLAARFRRDVEKNIPPTLTSEAGMKKNQRVSRW